VSVGTDKASPNDAAEGLRARATQAYADQCADEARDRRVVEYLPLVRHIVRKIVSSLSNHMDMEDLISAGTLGLVKAARSYDPGRDSEFKTYAYIRIRGAVLDELRSKSFVPASVHKQLQRIRHAYEKIIAQTGQPPEDEELAAKLGISPQKMYRTLQEARRQQFLSIHGLSEDQPALGQLVPQDGAPSPQDQVERKELLESLSRAIVNLPERDRLIVLLYYERDLTMKEIAQVLGLTESRVSQLHASAIFKLSMKLGARA